MIARRGFLASILAAGVAPGLMLHAPAMRLWVPPQPDIELLRITATDVLRQHKAWLRLAEEAIWREINPPVNAAGQAIRIGLPVAYLRGMEAMLKTPERPWFRLDVKS